MSGSVTRSCTSKQRYPDYKTAYLSRKALEVIYNDRALMIYACGNCDGYHIGHSTLGDSIAIRLALMKKRGKAQQRLRKTRWRIAAVQKSLATVKKHSEVQHEVERLSRKTKPSDRERFKLKAQQSILAAYSVALMTLDTEKCNVEMAELHIMAQWLQVEIDDLTAQIIES